MWLTWHCFVAYTMWNLPESVAFGDRAIKIGEEAESDRVLAYAYVQRAWAANNYGTDERLHGLRREGPCAR